jgi:pimeloyl-ACP methyl ester carboxylesterase
MVTGTRGAPRIVQVNGVELCVQAFGDPADPAILLIMGRAGSMDWWEDEFCGRLAAGGRYVIRYDHRDTGQSTHYPPGQPGYSGTDLVEDAIGVLDALGVARAHVVGMSMGGALAQLLALAHPDRLASLTLISTTGGAGDPDLPPPDPRLAAGYADLKPPEDWSDREAVIEYLVASVRPLLGSHPDDEAARRAFAARVVDRSTDMEASQTNHDLLDGPGPWRERLGEITAPTLVIHGAEDPMFPPAHGVALAEEIPGASLLLLERTGHELPRAAWDEVVPALIRHTGSG